MFATLKALVPKDKDYPERVWTHEWREQFRTSSIYDNLQHPFSMEKAENGEYVPINQRRPSVRFGLPKIIVSDSTALLFGEGHFPAIVEEVEDDDGDGNADSAENEAEVRRRKRMWADLIKETRLKEIMLDAAVRGSVGSIAIHFALKRGRVFWKVMRTQFLTPFWDPEEPDKLLKVVEKYKVKGRALRERGYDIADDDLTADFWFMREWNRIEEVFYMPWPAQTLLSGSGKTYDVEGTRDPVRSVVHGLGFVPIQWIRNLPGGDEIDGVCTFECALDNSIEIDYQLSQGGRGLKYSSDPTLHVKDPAYDSQPIIKSGANAIRTGPEGDVRLLEISGTASAAVLDYVRFLREISLEVAGGNRASPERLSGAQSGRAMELMNQSLIWLADKLRTSYGEYGLLPMLNMVVAANRVYEIRIKGKVWKIGELGDPEASRLCLKWPPWYPPTAADHASMAGAIKSYRDAGVMSRETGVSHIAHDFDVENVDKEIALIKGEEQEKADRELDAQKQLSAAKSPPAPVAKTA